MTITVAGTNSTITFSDSTTQLIPSKIINFQRLVWRERTVAFTNQRYYVPWKPTPMVTKLQANSTLLVKVNISMRTNYSDCLHWTLTYGANPTKYQGTMPYDAGFSANARPYHSVFYITGDTQVGTYPIRLFWDTANNNDGNKPCDNYNPGYIDDNRMDQEYSQIVVFEMAP